MESNNPQEQPPIAQSIITPSPTRTHQPTTALLILGGIFLLGTGLTGGYLIASNRPNSSPAIDPMVKISPTVQQVTPVVTAAVDATANWQIYKTPYYTMKLPSSWKVANESNGSDILAEVRLITTSPAEDMDLSITVATIDTDLGLEKFWTEETSIILDGIPTKRLTGYSGVAGRAYKSLIAVEKNNLKYLIISNNYMTNDLTEINKIIATFRFINQ